MTSNIEVRSICDNMRTIKEQSYST